MSAAEGTGRIPAGQIPEGYLTEHVLRVGSGEPMLLVHGLGHRKEAWDAVLPALAGRFDVAAIDLPGFGGAPMLDEAPTTVALATFCARVMDELGWDRAHVVGNSLGGLIALRLGSADRALSVTAISPAGQARGVDKAIMTVHLRALRGLSPILKNVSVISDTAWGRRVALRSVFSRPERMSAAVARLALQGLADTPAFEVTMDAIEQGVDDLGPVEVPTTIAWGTQDAVLLPVQGRRWAEVLPGADLVPLEGLGHTPMSDDADVVAGVITRTALAAERAG